MTSLRLPGFGGYLTKVTVEGLASKSLEFYFIFFLKGSLTFWTLAVFDSEQICLNSTNDFGFYPMTDLFGSGI